MTKNALVVGLALVCLEVSASAVKAQKPSDGCALLQAAEIQALAGTAKVGVGKVTTDALGSRTCQYEWGTGGNVQTGRSFLNVSATPDFEGLSWHGRVARATRTPCEGESGHAQHRGDPRRRRRSHLRIQRSDPSDDDRAGEREHAHCLA